MRRLAEMIFYKKFYSFSYIAYIYIFNVDFGMDFYFDIFCVWVFVYVSCYIFENIF